jgi:hypothetical protein
MPPRYVFFFLERWGVKFSSNSHCSHEVPIKFLLVPSIIHQNPFVLIMFSNSSHQIHLVPSLTHQNPCVLIKFSNSSHQIPMFPLITHQNPFVPISITHQNPFVLIKFSSNSFCSHQVPINFLLFPTQPYINPHKVLNFGIKSFFNILQLGNLVLEIVPW